MAWLEVSETKKVLGDQPRSYSNDFQGKQTMEQKSFLFNVSRLEVNNYITIIECGEENVILLGSRTSGKTLIEMRNWVQ